jgi:predicted dehydrogenase
MSDAAGNGNGNGNGNGTEARRAADRWADGRSVALGLVGAGRIASTYAEILAGNDVATVVGVADPAPAAAAAAAEVLGCPAFASHEELAEAVHLDAVVVCSPPSTHVPIGTWFLDRGIAVLCEKPFAIDVAGAEALHEAAERTDTLVTMAAKFRFADDVVRAKHILDSGILGDLIVFENAFTSRVDMSQRWNADPEVAGGGVLIDNGTHSVDIVRYFLGPIAEVLAVEGKRAQRLAVEDTARIFLRSVEGVIGTIDLSWSLDKSLEHYLWIYGSDGELRVGWRSSEFRQVSNPSWVAFGSGYDKAAAMGGSVENFCNAVAGREPLLITVDDAMASVAVVEQAYESMRSEHWVPVPASAAGDDPQDRAAASAALPVADG